jgi:hypothetical protein
VIENVSIAMRDGVKMGAELLAPVIISRPPPESSLSLRFLAPMMACVKL